MGFNVSQIKSADCAAFSPHSGFVSLSLYVLFSHDKKLYLPCKGTTFPSPLIIFEWKSLAKPRISPKMFYKSAFSRLQKPFVYSILPFVHVLSCENNHSSLHLLNTTQPPILFNRIFANIRILVEWFWCHFTLSLENYKVTDNQPLNQFLMVIFY